MKKLLSVFLCVFLCMLLTACDIPFFHSHSCEYVCNDDTHQKIFTCGCASPDIAETHTDADGDKKCDVCGYPMHPYKWISYAEGHVKQTLCGCCDAPAVVYPHENWDADLHCDICGYLMSGLLDRWYYSDTHHWQTPEGDAVFLPVYGYGAHIDADDDVVCDVCGYNFINTEPVPTNYFLRNQAGCEWLNETKAEDIAEIKIITEAAGVAPGTFKNIARSVEETAIARIFEAYYRLNTTPVPREMGEIDGGGAVTVKFIFKDDTQKDIYINNGNYRDTNGNYWELFYTPNFEAEEYASSYGFITYQGTGILRSCDPTGMERQYICQFPMDEIEFAEVTDEIVLDTKELCYYIETEFGKLYFLSEIYFYIDGAVEGNTMEELKPVYYQLSGKNLDELINQYAEHTN